jgi:hypothetical protein
LFDLSKSERVFCLAIKQGAMVRVSYIVVDA